MMSVITTTMKEKMKTAKRRLDREMGRTRGAHIETAKRRQDREVRKTRLAHIAEVGKNLVT